MDRSVTYDLLFTFHERNEIDGDFSRKLQNFLTPVYFAPSLTGFPLELDIGAGSEKKRNDGAIRRSNNPSWFVRFDLCVIRIMQQVMDGFR